MVYLSTFILSEQKVKNPNIYPYHVFSKIEIKHIKFDRITVLYGSNASGKSTLLNIIAQALKIKGVEKVDNEYFDRFVSECRWGFGDSEDGHKLHIPDHSQYIKSEDILYEVKKIQRDAVLKESCLLDSVQKGIITTSEVLQQKASSWAFEKRIDIIKFAQEKYSNGETTLQILENTLESDALYLLDEPEVSLSPQSQVYLANKINEYARLLGCQFIIATHSPFMLGTLDSTIYNLDTDYFKTCQWNELENIRYFYQFFKSYEKDFMNSKL